MTEGPPQKWQHLAPATRICRTSAALMRLCCRLRAAGVRGWELEAAGAALVTALEARRYEEAKLARQAGRR